MLTPGATAGPLAYEYLRSTIGWARTPGTHPRMPLAAPRGPFEDHGVGAAAGERAIVTPNSVQMDDLPHRLAPVPAAACSTDWRS